MRQPVIGLPVDYETLLDCLPSFLAYHACSAHHDRLRWRDGSGGCAGARRLDDGRNGAALRPDWAALLPGQYLRIAWNFAAHLR